MTSTLLPRTETESRAARKPAKQALDRAILQTVAYADIFHYPLTAAEVHRYLVSLDAPLDTVEKVLGNGRLIPRALSQFEEFFTLPGREEVVETRRRRAEVAAALWPRAARYGQIIGNLPFVRMVAVTGALAVDNVEPEADIDYLVVTEPGRLWLCRALPIAVVRMAARRGDPLCPNYFLSERALVFDERNLFTAHEVVQMVPVAGHETYQAIRRLNGWTAEYLPNAEGPPRVMNGHASRKRAATSVTEAALRMGVGARLEAWEMRRKVRKLHGHRPGAPEAAFSPDWCKGHFEGHGHRALAAFDERLRALEGVAG